MKFDKETLIGIVICVLVLFGWGPFCRYMGWSRAADPVSTPPVAMTVPAVNPAVVSVPAPEAPVASAPSETGRAVNVPELPPVVLKNALSRVTINPNAGGISSIVLKNFKNADRQGDITLDQTHGGNGALSVHALNEAWTLAKVEPLKTDEDAYSQIRVMRNAQGQKFTVVQTWTLREQYALHTKIKITNHSKSPLLLSDLVVVGGDLAAWAVVSGDKVRTPSHRLDYMTVDGSFVDISATADKEDFFKGGDTQVKWIGVGNKYFVTLLTADTPFVLFRNRAIESMDNIKAEILTIGAKFQNQLLAPDQSCDFELRYYAGPKEVSFLNAFEPSCGKVMHLAWGPLDYLARLLLWVLVKMHAVIGSYGWSIILLTLIVRILFYPITAKANASMKKMQTVQPKIQDLRAKYKDNPQLLNTKMMELYRTEKINPFGGCLPILLQIPVFFALYATLDGAVELRQVSFWWIKDLAAADTVAVIPLYFYNLPVNPLVLVMTGLMVVQQRMMPTAMEPAQQKMMMAMPIVMLIFMYDMPSGLTLYWTVSNIFSILQIKLQQRNNRQQAVTPAAKQA